jgi:hypothetical protein
LYRYNLAEMKLTTKRVLLDNIQAVDPTLVFFNGFWWLFFTSRIYSNTHLYLFFSENFDGEFKAHPQNPVKIDIRSARPAGTPFVHQGHLYRPAQDCSKTYGGRVVVNKVNVITTDQFSEEVVHAVEPDETGYYRDGLHTISGVGDITLIDGKRYRANWHYFVSQLRNRLKFNQQRYV